MTVRVNAYVWNRHDRDAQEGAMIHDNNRFTFVPASHLRRVADRLHDIADDIESGQ